MSFGSKGGSSVAKAPPGTTTELAPTHNELAAKQATAATVQRTEQNPASMALLSDEEAETQRRAAVAGQTSMIG